MTSLLEIRDLSISINQPDGRHALVRNLNLSLGSSERFALVGESGCGKSMTALAIVGLLEGPSVQVDGGEIRFEGRNLLELNRRELRAVRGKHISMIFQEPMTALNPVMRIGNQITEVLREHTDVSQKAARLKAVELLERVGIQEPERRIRQYPHEFSGGMRQRAMIALAIACKPKLLIADEPTTALDVTVQAQILNLLRDLQADMGLSLLLISHNLALVSSFCHRTAIMYAGDLVEEGQTVAVLGTPKHPYTAGLIGCLPPEPERVLEGRRKLNEIPGQVPPVDKLRNGCRFFDRCILSKEQCRVDLPAVRRDGRGTKWRCIH